MTGRILCRLPGATGKRKVFRLADVVQPLLEGQIEKLTSGAVKRILNSEKDIAQSGMAHVSSGHPAPESSLCPADTHVQSFFIRA